MRAPKIYAELEGRFRACVEAAAGAGGGSPTCMYVMQEVRQHESIRIRAVLSHHRNLHCARAFSDAVSQSSLSHPAPASIYGRVSHRQVYAVCQAKFARSVRRYRRILLG
jgi:hypothetical protein